MWRGLDVEIDIAGAPIPISLRNCVARYEFRSALSEPFELTVELRLRNPNFDVREVVGHATTVRFLRERYLSRMDGIVSRLRQLSSLPDGVSRYELTLVPPMWLATRRRDHRIFQDLSVIEIATSVLAAYGARMPPTANLCGPHRPREYCVQYGETDLEFLTRILADEGIVFYFDHHQKLSFLNPEDGASTLTLTDDTRTLSSLDQPTPYVPPTGDLLASQPHVNDILVSSGLETSVTTLRDYDFERPAFNFESRADVRDGLFTNEHNLESYTYEVGQFTSTDDRERASQLLEEARGPSEVELLGASFALAPGTRLTVVGHPNERANGQRLVISTRSRVSATDDNEALTYHSHEVVPASRPYRAPRRPKPRIHGTQTAFVVGKQLDADEIDVDQYGRVKVRFTWDRRPTAVEGKPTRFIRVSQGWAGQGYGMVLLPRVGDELVITYLDGDPDEPIAVGRVHNAVYTSPLKLPDTDDTTVSIWKSRSSPADPSSTEDRYNMIRMQDKAGEEMLEFRAQRDFHHEVLHDSTQIIGNSQSIKVKGVQTSQGRVVQTSSETDLTLSAKGTLKVEATTVLVNGSGVTSVHGKASLFLHGGTEVHMSSGSAITIVAPHVTISGDGSVDVNGGVINLNC